MFQELVIADYFKWDLSQVRNLTCFEMKMIQQYFKKVELQHKREMSRAKHGRK